MKSSENYYSFQNPFPRVCPLGEGEIHVVRLDVEELRPFLRELFGLLSFDELARASRYRYPKDGDQFILVRGALRLMLGRYLALHPQELAFEYNPQGKPKVGELQNQRGVRFNISFSGNIAVYAFSHDIVVGVDVEQVDATLDFHRVKDRFLNKRDSEFLDSLPETIRQDSFFALWTLHEAKAKAEGEGIFLRAFQTPFSWEQWTACSLFPGVGYSATLVMEKPGNRLLFWNWSNEAIGLFHGPTGKKE